MKKWNDAARKKGVKMEMRQLQTGREVKQELNLQDQVECLSQEPTATQKSFFFRFIPIIKVSARHMSKCSLFSPVPGGARAGVCKEAAGR